MEMGKTKPTKPDEVLAASAQAQKKWKVAGNHLWVSKSNCHVIMASFYYFDRRGFDKSLWSHFSPWVEIFSYNGGKQLILAAHLLMHSSMEKLCNEFSFQAYLIQIFIFITRLHDFS